MLVTPVVSILGGSLPPVVPAVSTPARLMSAAPAVSTHGGSQAFSLAKDQYLSPVHIAQWFRVGPGRIVISPSLLLRNVGLPFLVPRGCDRASLLLHRVLRPILSTPTPSHYGDPSLLG